MIHTLEHAGAVLDLFSGERPEWGATTVADALGISKSGAHNLLVSLSSIGLLRRVGRGHYRLGWRALEMVDAIASTDELIGAVKPVMRELVRACGGPAALGVGANGRIVALTDERGTYVGGCSWFSRAAIEEVLSSDDPLPRPVVVREADICHVAMEIEHGRSALRMAVGTSLPLARVDRSLWVAAAAAKMAHRLRKVWRVHDDPTAAGLVRACATRAGSVD
jgi:IclR-like helix-turn-helix domain-containing protein